MKFHSFLSFALTITTFSSCNSQEKKVSNFEESISLHRKSTHQEFLAEGSSPLKEDDRKKFVGLNYFVPDSSFRFEITPIWLADSLAEIVFVQTSTGVERKMKKAALLQTQKDGITFEITAFYTYAKVGNQTRLDEKRIFIPFSDETSGFDTYGGGRYLDLQIEGQSEKFILDFNFAYNPYCAYNSKYSCPLPPAYNHIPMAIKAGEKNFKS